MVTPYSCPSALATRPANGLQPSPGPPKLCSTLNVCATAPVAMIAVMASASQSERSNFIHQHYAPVGAPSLAVFETWAVTRWRRKRGQGLELRETQGTRHSRRSL